VKVYIVGSPAGKWIEDGEEIMGVFSVKSEAFEVAKQMSGWVFEGIVDERRTHPLPMVDEDE